MASNYYIIFGAGVGPTGKPSCSMEWRVKDAVLSATDYPDAGFIAAGGARSSDRPAEAQVIKMLLLSRGVAPELIIADTDSQNTIQSVINCRRIMAERGDSRQVYVCTSYYHIPRCRLLFAILGIWAKPGSVNTESAVLKRPKWNYLFWREVAATSKDIPLALGARLKNLAS